MGYPRAIAVTFAYIALLTSCGESALAPRGEVAAAEDAISAWVARHPDGWTSTTTTDAVLTRPSWTPSCTDAASNGYVSLRLVTGRGDIELAFRCPVGEGATAEDLQLHFIHAVPWNLPTGISSPNWRFQAWLPLSSVFNGVTFESPRAGLLAVDIQSTMSGILAENTRRSCVPAADDAAVPGCVIMREHRVPLRLRFTVRADLSALR